VRVNETWHRDHPTPKNASTDERIAWHVDHAQAHLRPIPDRLEEEIARRRRGEVAA